MAPASAAETTPAAPSPDPAAGVAAPLTVRGGGANTNAATDGALFFGSFLYILAVALVGLTPAPYLVAACGPARGTALLAACASASALVEIAISPLVGALIDAVGRKPVLLATAGVAGLAHAAAACLATTAGPPAAAVQAAAVSASAASAASASASAAAAAADAASTVVAAAAASASAAVGGGAAWWSRAVLPLLLAKFAAGVSVGVFFLTSGTMLADWHQDNPKRLAASTGGLFALVNAGFGVGVASSGLLPAALDARSLKLAYAWSAGAAGCATLALAAGVNESLPPNSAGRVSLASLSPAARRRALNPLACTRLFRRGARVRQLSVIMLLFALPAFMGDVLQVFLSNEWGLGRADIVQVFSLLAFFGVLANVVAAGGGIRLLGGLRPFTMAATFSNLLYWVGLARPPAGLSRPHAATLAAVAGALGPAKSLGVGTLLTQAAAEAGLTQGQLSGDRANLFAWAKVVSPLLYQQLYVSGKARGAPALPFVVNAALTAAALYLARAALAPALAPPAAAPAPVPAPASPPAAGAPKGESKDTPHPKARKAN